MASDKLKKLRQELDNTSSRGNSSGNASSSNRSSQTSNRSSQTSSSQRNNSSYGSSSKLQSVRAELDSTPSRFQSRGVPKKTENEISKANKLMTEIGDYLSGSKYTSHDSSVRKTQSYKQRIKQSKADLDKIIEGFGSKFSQEYKDILQSMRDSLDKAEGELGKASAYWKQFGSEDEYNKAKYDATMLDKYDGYTYDNIKNAIRNLDKKAKGPSDAFQTVGRAKAAMTEEDDVLSNIANFFMPGIKDKTNSIARKVINTLEPTLTDEGRYGNDAYKEMQWLRNNANAFRTTEDLKKQIEQVENVLKNKYGITFDNSTTYSRQQDWNHPNYAGNNEAAYGAAYSQDMASSRPSSSQANMYHNGSEEEVNRLMDKYDELQQALYMSERKDTYTAMPQSQDFTQNSAYIPVSGESFFGGSEAENLYKYINDKEFARQQKGIAQVDNQSQALEKYIALDNITDEERATFNYIYNTQGGEAAKKYLDEYLMYDLNARNYQKTVEEARAFAKENPVGSSILSIPQNVMSGLGYASAAGQGLSNIISGENKPVDWNTGLMANTYGKSSTVRDTVANDVIGGGPGAFMYQTVMSMGDSVMTMPLGPWLGAGMLGGSAATNAAKTAKDAGATDGQALMIGALEGAAETVFEHFSLGSLKAMTITERATTIRQAIKNMVKQGTVEGSEELFTTLANTISEEVVLADLSTYNQSKQRYIEQGYSEAEAEKMATMDWWNQLGQDTLGGAMSGFTFGFGGNFVMNNASIQSEGRRVDKTESADALITSTLENITDTSSRAYQLAQTMSEYPTQRTTRNLGKLAVEVDNYANRGEVQNEEASKVRETMSASNAFDRMVEPVREERASALEQQNNEATLEQTAERKADIEMGNEQAVKTEPVKAEGKGKFEQKIFKGEKAQSNALKEHDVTVTRDGKSERISTRIEVVDTSSVDNSVTLKLSNGEEVNSDEVQFRDKKTQALLTEAKSLAQDGWTAPQIQSFIDNYDGETSPSAYATGFKMAAMMATTDNQGITGSLKNYMASVSNVLNGDQARAAYSVGLDLYDKGMDAMATAKAESEAYLKESKKQTSREMKNSASREKTRQAKIDKAVSEKGSEGVRESGFTYDGKVTKQNKGTIEALRQVSKVLGINLVVSDKLEGKIAKRDKDGNLVKDKDGNQVYLTAEANGKYVRSEGTVYLSLDADRPLRVVLAHELTHFIQAYSPSLYESLKGYIRKYMNRDGSNQFERQVDYYMARQNLSRNAAIDEVVADACDMFLDASRFTQEMANDIASEDRTLAEKIRDFIEQLLKDLKAFFSEQGRQSGVSAILADSISEEDLNTLKGMWDAALSSAVATYNTLDANDMARIDKSFAPKTNAETAEEFVQHSFKSLFEALGFSVRAFDEMGNPTYDRTFYDKNGKVRHRVTYEDVCASPVGAFINQALKEGTISENDAVNQRTFFMDIANMALDLNTDFGTVMQFAGAVMFTGMKTNSDEQYNTTYDFASICTKTQAVIDAMSARMMKVKRRLTAKEIEGIYRKEVLNGQPVPCPECFVFARWVNVGTLLQNMSTYQRLYEHASPKEVYDAYKEKLKYFQDLADQKTKEKGRKYTAGDVKSTEGDKIKKKYYKLLEKIEKKQSQRETVTEAEKAELADLEEKFGIVKGLSWIESVYFGGDGQMPDETHEGRMNSRAIVPSDVLYNLNAGGKFAVQYPEAWGFRTNQGVGYGKAITPPAEAVLGEGILITTNSDRIKDKKNGTLVNPFMNVEVVDGQAYLTDDALKVLKTARKRMKAQSFLGGQRFQSFSDARLEYASDYIIAALEVQLMNGKVQAYTKVPGAVPMFSALGFSTNQSLMPRGSGINADGHILDTDVGGMNQLAEMENRAKFDLAGNITIGVNDAHIRALMNDAPTVINGKIVYNFIRDFIIPYHASGGNSDLIRSFRSIQEGVKEDMPTSTDYTKVQGDKEIPDKLLKQMYAERGMSASEINAKIEDIHKFREQRFAILTGNTETIDKKYIRAKGNEFLSQLYDKFNGGEFDGAEIPGDAVEHMLYPNEYWDKTVDYAHSGVNTQIYLDLCERLGWLHRFSGKTISGGKFVSVSAYDRLGKKTKMTDLAYKEGSDTEIEPFFWKTLVDRRMYDNNGKYIEQKDVTLNDTVATDWDSFGKLKEGTAEYKADTAERVAREVADMSQADLEAFADEQYSLKGMTTEQIDADYMKAVESGDMKIAQAMVDEYAKMMGYTYGKVYHGTPDNDFRAFRNGIIFFTSNEDTADEYRNPGEFWRSNYNKGRTIGAYIKLDNPLMLDNSYSDYRNEHTPWQEWEPTVYGRVPANAMDATEVAERAKAEGYDGVFIANDKDTKWKDSSKYLKNRGRGDSVIAFRSNQVKSADAVTYDKDGNVIPLSQRFNENKEDIYYSLKGMTDEQIDTDYMKAVESGDMETAQAMVDEYARMKGYSSPLLFHGTDEYDWNDGNPKQRFRVFKANEYIEEENGISRIKGYFTEDEEYAHHYGTPFPYYVKMQNPLDIPDMETTFRGWKRWFANRGINNVKFDSAIEEDSLKGANYGDGRKLYRPYEFLDFGNYWNGDGNVTERIEAAGYDGIRWDYGEQAWMPFNASAIKSADPVTYDKNGNIIPLSQRFNEETEDVYYSLKDSPEITPSSTAWTKGATFDEVKAAHPTLFGLDTDETAQQNTTQVSITKSTYRKIFDIISELEGANADNVTILDASSGLGGGTEVGRSEYGFNVDDVEPYPSANYNPRYRDYTAIPRQYDYIISNAVLNVLPQDLRDNLVYTMSTLLKSGGKMFINVRGDDVLNSKGKIAIDADHMEYFIPKNASTGNYQKGFTLSELIAYLQDALGEGYTVEGTRRFGKVSVIVTKDQSPIQKFIAESGIRLGETDEPQYSLKDTDSMSNREILAGAFDVIAQTDKEKEGLKRYRESVETLDGIQAKLDEARKEIHTIMFTKGGRAQMGDRLAELQANVKKWEKQLTLWDGKLIRLQASKPIRDIVTRARANEAKQTAMKYRERIAGVRDSNAVKDVRRKLQKLYNDLKKKALHPTEGRYIPAPLMNTMLSVLETIDYRGGREDTKIHAKLTDMYLQYQELKKDEDYLNQSAYDEELNGMLDELIKAVGEKYVRDMNRQEINEVYRIVRAIAYTLNQKVKQIGQASAVSNYELGERAIQEINDAKGPLSTVTRIYNMGSLSPMRFFRMISGWARDSVMQNLAKQLNDGQRKMNEILMQGYAIFDEYVGSKSALKEFQTFHGKGDLITVLDGDGKPMLDKKGNEIKITHDMLVALYMHSLNEDNRRHVLGGGVLVPNLNAYLKGKGNKAYIEDSQMIRFSEEQLNKLFKDNLTTYDMKYAQTVHDFFNTFSKQVINETSMALNGYKKAEVDNYFPIHVDGDFLGAQFDSLVMDGTLEGMGILKQRVKSSKPIYLEGASDAVIRNLNSIAKYGGLAIPIKNFQRVYNVSTVLTDQTGEIIDRFHDSVQKAIGNKWGDMGKSYISELMSDLQYGTQGRRGWDTLVNKFFTSARGKFAQATLAMNLSVTLKQAASYPTAASELGWAPLAKALMSTEKMDLDTLAKYTPIMWIRSHGFVNTELGDAVSPTDWSAKVPGIMGWIQKMDIATVTKLGKATEFYIRQTHPELKVGSDDYWRAVADKFNDVVEKTQPNYSVMQRPEVLRSQNAILRSLTMFMTQRLQNYNILFDAVGEYRAARSSGDTAWAKTAGRNLRRAVTSQVVAAGVIAAMTMAVSMLMHRMKRYRDDDDEITAESFMGAFFGDMLSTVVGSFLGGSEVYEIINNFMNGTTYDVLDAPNISMVNDLIGAFEEFGAITQKIAEKQAEAEENGELYEGDADVDKLLAQLKEMGFAVGKFFGVPADNVEKLAMGVYYYSLDAANGTLWESDIERTKTDYYKQMAKALEDGDIDRYNRLHDKAVDLIKSESKYTGDNAITDAENTIAKGLKTYLKKNDERIRQAAEARINSNNEEYGRIRKELIAEGYPESAVVGAINDVYDEIKKGVQEETVDYVNEYAPDVYENSDIVNAYRNNNPEALDDIVEYYITEKGMTETEARAKIDEIGRKEIRTELYDAIDNNDMSTAKESIKSLQEHGAENGDISSSLTSTYKDMYLDYYIHSETGKMKDLESKLHGLGLTDKKGKNYFDSDKFKSWISKYQEGTKQVEEAKVTSPSEYYKTVQQSTSSRKGIITAMSKKYHPLWEDYYMHDDTENLKKLEDQLRRLNITDSYGRNHYDDSLFAYWREQANK